MKLDLEDLTPKASSFTGTFEDENGEKQEFKLNFRPFNLRDESWLKRNFGGDKLQKVFDNLEIEPICRIAFQQLDNDSKKRLFGLNFTVINEETGEEIDEKLTGPERISYLVHGLNELMDLMKSLLETRGVSLPTLEQLGEEELGKLTEALRNSGFKMNDENPKPNKTGEKSST